MTFEAAALKQHQPSSQHAAAMVTISQVVTDADLVHRSALLEDTLATGRYTQFCERKIELCRDNQAEAAIWSFLKVLCHYDTSRLSPCTDFDVDSSSRFPFRAQTDVHNCNPYQCVRCCWRV